MFKLIYNVSITIANSGIQKYNLLFFTDCTCIYHELAKFEPKLVDLTTQNLELFEQKKKKKNMLTISDISLAPF